MHDKRRTAAYLTAAILAMAAGFAFFQVGCSSPVGGGAQDRTDQQGDQLNEQGIPVDMAAFLVVREEDQFDQVSQMLPAVGGSVELPGVGSVLVPESDGAAGSTVTLAEASLTDAALQAFTDTNEAFTPVGPVMQLTVTETQAAPGYVIVQLPAPDAQARIIVSAYLDADTSTPAWTSVGGSYDPSTGLLTAPVGIGLLRPVAGGGTAGKSTIANQQSSTTHTGSATVAVGGREFSTDWAFTAEEPTEELEVTAGDAPIAVRGRIGLQLSRITNQPLDSLTVTSDYGPRPAPEQGASTFHGGVDYRAANGTTVRAAGDGTVTRASCQNSSVNCGRDAAGNITGGFIVEIDHGGGEKTSYMHLTKPPDFLGPAPFPANCTNLSVCVGDAVTGGQAIATSDSTGGVNPHLHFTVSENGTSVDPEDVLNSGTVTLTVAMALDFEIQEGTQQAIPVTRGNILTVEDLVGYVNVFDLSNVIAGRRKLQFVLMQSDGGFEVLAETPLTIHPKLTALTPDQGVFDDPIVATGLGFDYKKPANNVVDMSDIGFGGPGTATPTRATPDSLEFKVPLGAVFGSVKVTVNGVDSEDTVDFTPFVSGRFFNDSDETNDPVTMQVDVGPNATGCGVLSSGATSFSVGPGDSHEFTIRAGDSFTATATWTDPNDPSNELSETFDFFCDGDDTGTRGEYRGVETDFSVYTGGGGFLTP